MNDKTFAIFDSPLNTKIINDLNGRGQNVIVFPQFEKIKIDSGDFKIENQDWLIFTDVNTVDFFVDLLNENGVSLFELDELRVCAFGDSIADKLRIYQLHADLIPSKLDPDTVISEIKEYEYEFETKRFLILVAKNEAKEIVDAFQKESANSNVCSIFEYGQSTISARSKALLQGGAIDEFIINSPEDLCDFLNLQSNPDIAIAATNSIIYENLKQHGFVPKYFVG